MQRLRKPIRRCLYFQNINVPPLKEASYRYFTFLLLEVAYFDNYLLHVTCVNIKSFFIGCSCISQTKKWFYLFEGLLVKYYLLSSTCVHQSLQIILVARDAWLVEWICINDGYIKLNFYFAGYSIIINRSKMTSELPLALFDLFKYL